MLDNSRTLSARVDWRTEAIMLINRFISDPDCIGYSKIIIKYTNESSYDLLVSSKVNVPLAIDRDKVLLNGELNIGRFSNCLKLDSPEYKLYYRINLQEISSENKVIDSWEGSNLPVKYANNKTFVTVTLPVKIISAESFSYGLLTVVMSASAEYLQAKVL
jgi:hypothetical protein